MSSYKGTYVDLDTIFDTRIPIAMSISPENTAIELYNQNYYKRHNNNVGYIPSDVFLTYYEKRNKKVLKFSKVTKIVEDLILPQYYEIIQDGSMVDIENLPPFYINYYPYSFNQSELEILNKSISKLFGGCKVELINIPLKDLDNKWVLNHVNILYMYEGLKWLEYRSIMEDMMLNPLTKISLVVPLLLYNNKNKITKEGLIEWISRYQTVIDIFPIEVELFSAIP